MWAGKVKQTVRDEEIINETCDLVLMFKENDETIWDKIVKQTNISKLQNCVHYPKSGMSVTVTFKCRETMLKYNSAMQNQLKEFRLKRCFPLVPASVIVTLKNVHFCISDERLIQELEDNCCTPIKISYEYDKYNHRTRTRYAEFNREEFYQNPLKSFIKIANKEITIHYFGLVQSCFLCGEEGHKQDECPEFPKAQSAGNAPRFKNIKFRNLNTMNESNAVTTGKEKPAVSTQENNNYPSTRKPPQPIKTKTKENSTKIRKGSIDTHITSTPKKSQNATTDIQIDKENIDQLWKTYEVTDIGVGDQPTPTTPQKRDRSNDDIETNPGKKNFEQVK